LPQRDAEGQRRVALRDDVRRVAVPLRLLARPAPRRTDADDLRLRKLLPDRGHLGLDLRERRRRCCRHGFVSSSIFPVIEISTCRPPVASPDSPSSFSLAAAMPPNASEP